MRSATYLLPIRAMAGPSGELTDYLRWVSTQCELIVVDGSPAPVFASAHEAWSSFATHVPPDPALKCANGKVHGVLTGLAMVGNARMVIADDDVRYSASSLAQCLAGLNDADVVRPQNYFDPLPWHARWDTARILLNRVTGGDFPGTLGLRTRALQDCGGYDGDVLFENLELIRTIERAGGRCISRPDILVRRLPPTARHFFRQRVRHAYDEFARPPRMAAALTVLPGVALGAQRRRFGALARVAAFSILAAEAGRRRARGREVFPPSASLLAPVWILERGVCSWLAVFRRVGGGIRYSDHVIVSAATPSRRGHPSPRPLETSR